MSYNAGELKNHVQKNLLKLLPEQWHAKILSLKQIISKEKQ